jgi:hypothetical protein
LKCANVPVLQKFKADFDLTVKLQLQLREIELRKTPTKTVIVKPEVSQIIQEEAQKNEEIK